ncbi:Nucleolar protein 13 [Psilocybe cubensis]|uniref:RRM domain-containing protein n=2 Tax=Psilocybe cubensis TaxID=181762 RepID=A0A8H7Y0N7_PSICU|nr:Nucleolar protein 13 [Psilocybe cubensis]KAH9482285.1 Nucleolar protein 13 [Psilocybe cubensis]
MSSPSSSSKSSSPAPEIKEKKRKRKETVPAEDIPASKVQKTKRKRKAIAPVEDKIVEENDSAPSSEVKKIAHNKNSAPSDDEEDSSQGLGGPDSEKNAVKSDAEDIQDSEEPVLSHAERRRKKKEEKLAAKLAEEGKALKKRKLKDGSAKVVDNSAPTKRQNSVWVGNLSFKTTQENLRAFFDGVGEITRINMPTKAVANGPGQKPENRGFAYVDFATPDAKITAIALSENPLLGRKLLIKDGDDFKGRPAAIGAENVISDPVVAHKTHSKTAQKILRAQKQPPAPTLFLGNLGFDTTEDSIRELFEAHRPGHKKASKDTPDAKGEDKKPKDAWIRKVRMGTFEDSGACKGFAFVDFMTVDDATSALINPKNHHLNGRNLKVEYAGADAVRRGAPKNKQVDNALSPGKRSSRKERPQRDADDSAEPASDWNGAPKSSTTENAQTDSTPKQQWVSHKEKLAGSEGVRHKGPKSRPKPGAALALAKRESAAIVPNQGQKITF